MRYPLFGIGLQGKSSAVTAQTRINMYLEYRKENDKTQIAAYGTAGLILTTNYGDTPIRGMLGFGDFIYKVHRGTFWEENNAGVKVNRGTLLTTTGRCSLVDNGNVIQILDGLYGYTYNTTTLAFAQITDPAFVAGKTNTWLNGYYIKDRTGSPLKIEQGRFDISTDGSTYNALNFANAESNPDPIVRVFADHGQLILFGDKTTEFWGNSGALDFPLVQIGSATIEWGLAARWSLSKFKDSLIFLARNKMGQVQVIILNGYTPQVVSTVDEDYIFNTFSATDDATGLSYLKSGHYFYQINFPTANRSFLYDGTSDCWSELKSSGNRHLAEIGTLYLGKLIVSDYANGNAYQLDENTYTENGMSITRQITSRHIFDQTYVGLGTLELDFERGIGLVSGQGIDPMVGLEVSKDGGKTWGQELWRSMGKIGKFLNRTYWNRIGTSRDTVFRWTITDPVKVVLTGAWLDKS